ncbi:MAG: methionine adenosyltransferase [Methanomicrobiales archaeon]|nr:methionine adenosyltransferase [Methanomicrobiales archaeon]MDI6875667.1 methionine adenosyltransferase [Methanomicrobiales archaeon]
MERNIRVESIDQTPLEKRRIELVERKGIGHPDSIADGVAESVSRALSKAYIQECGGVLHHNTDQGEVIGGETIPAFGGGKVIRPIFVLVIGRATKSFNGVDIPTDAIALRAARDYLRTTLTNLDLESDVIVDVRMGVGSTDLREVFRTCGGQVPRANDTSFGVGHAPFSETELIVKNVSDYVDDYLRPRYPIYGHDMKFMGLRDGDTITLTVACAMVDRFCSDIKEYIEMRDLLQEQIESVARKYTDRRVIVQVNTADNLNEKSIFLTVTGTSAEMGDDGSVGRGNRCNGLITPNRPMSMEAVSGKNPINHIGKIYNLLATDVASRCVQRVDGIEEIYVRFLSQIGNPIDHPLTASIQVLPKAGADIRTMNHEIEGIVDDALENITRITEKVIRGELKTF